MTEERINSINAPAVTDNRSFWDGRLAQVGCLAAAGIAVAPFVATSIGLIVKKPKIALFGSAICAAEIAAAAYGARELALTEGES